MHGMSEVLPSVFTEQGDYIVLSNLSYFYSELFHVGILKAQIRNASGCRRIIKCSEKAIVENSFEKLGYVRTESGYDSMELEFRKELVRLFESSVQPHRM